MMRITFTPAMPFAATGRKYALGRQTPKKNKADPYPQGRLTIPSTRTAEANLAGNAAVTVFFNSVNVAGSWTGNSLIAAAYKL